MPSVPAEAPWELSLAAYLRQTTALPSLALKPLGLLDRYGAVAVGPEAAGFDGDDVPWPKIVRLEVRDVVEVVSDAAMAREAEKIRSMLPPVPGRKWVVDHAMALLGDIAGPRLAGARGGDVVSEIVYRGCWGGRRRFRPGCSRPWSWPRGRTCSAASPPPRGCTGSTCTANERQTSLSKPGMGRTS
ncbi:hypothetical protein ACFQ9X_07735 [Catenulispora yoronensis]